MMSTQLIAVRNTISKQVHEYPEAKARKILAHPVFGKVNEEVRTDKPEVLSEPFQLDENGERQPVESEDGERKPLKDAENFIVPLASDRPADKKENK